MHGLLFPDSVVAIVRDLNIQTHRGKTQEVDGRNGFNFQAAVTK